MSDPLRDVRDGEPLQIPAAAYNAWCAAARANNARAHDQTSSASAELLASGQVLVENTTEFDREQFDVMGVREPAILPADNPHDFGRPTFLKVDLVDQDDAGKFVVLAEPIAAGGFGRAWISGVCPVLLNVNDAGHRYAEGTDDGEGSSRAQSVADGSALILWKEDGTGDEKWAVIRLGNPSTNRLEKIELKSAFLKEGATAAAEGYLLTWNPGAGAWEGGAASGGSSDNTVDVFADAGFVGCAFEGDLFDAVKVENGSSSPRYDALNGGRLNTLVTASANATPSIQPNGAYEPLAITQTADCAGVSITLNLALTPWEADETLIAHWVSLPDGEGGRGGFWAARRDGTAVPGCGLEYDEDGKLRVKVAELVGDGLTVDATGECSRLKVDCAAVSACVSPLIPHAGCGMQEDTVEGLKYHSFDAAAVAGSYLDTWGTCGLDVNIPAVVAAITSRILSGLADALISAILQRILSSNALRSLFCKLACSCSKNPPGPPECDGEPIYEWTNADEWELVDDCDCENPIPPDEEGDDCDKYKEGTCCEGKASWSSDGTDWTLEVDDCPEGFSPEPPAGTGEDGDSGCTACPPIPTCEDCEGPVYQWVSSAWALVDACESECSGTPLQPPEDGDFDGEYRCGDCVEFDNCYCQWVWLAGPNVWQLDEDLCANWGMGGVCCPGQEACACGNPPEEPGTEPFQTFRRACV